MVLFAPAPMVLIPLALLLILSRPARFVPASFAWIAALVTLYWLAVPGGMADQTVKAWTVIASTLFVAYGDREGSSTVDRAVGAGLLASVMVFAWYVAFRIPTDAGVLEAQRATREFYLLLGDRLPAYRQLTNDLAEAAGGFLLVLPGMMILAGMSGLLVAWRWYHILADAPAGAPPIPFHEFRFSDHLLWLLALGLGGTVAQLADHLPQADLWPGNVVLVAGGLYVARGAAVILATKRRWSFELLLVAGFAVLFLLPIAFTGLFGVGLADTWLDFRRRAAAASGD